MRHIGWAGRAQPIPLTLPMTLNDISGNSLAQWSELYPPLGQDFNPFTFIVCPMPKPRGNWQGLSVSLPPKCWSANQISPQLSSPGHSYS